MYIVRRDRVLGERRAGTTEENLSCQGRTEKVFALDEGYLYSRNAFHIEQSACLRPYPDVKVLGVKETKAIVEHGRRRI
jgi:hypothetical protein